MLRAVRPALRRRFFSSGQSNTQSMGAFLRVFILPLPRTAYSVIVNSRLAFKVTRLLTLTHIALNPLYQPSPQARHARAIHRAQHVQQRRPQDPYASASPRRTSRASEIRRGYSLRRPRDLCRCRRRPRGVVHAVTRGRVVLWNSQPIPLRRERLRIPASDLGARQSRLVRSTAYHSRDQEIEPGPSSTENPRYILLVKTLLVEHLRCSINIWSGGSQNHSARRVRRDLSEACQE